MTPLAHRILKDLSLPAKRSRFNDAAGIAPKLLSAQFFEVSAVRDVAFTLIGSVIAGDLDPYVSFLPAPRTWIECVEPYPDGKMARTAYFLEELGERTRISVASDRTFSSAEYMSDSALENTMANAVKCVSDGSSELDAILKSQLPVYAVILCFIAIINTPHVFGRRQHMPHRGLERRLLSKRKTLGIFPLNAWTEIKLEVTPPVDVSDQSSVEARLTGKKALHFCRAHLRVRLGKIEVVSSHWRGDASLGTKRSRYRVVPPREGGAPL